MENTFNNREAAFSRFMEYKARQPVKAQRQLRRKYENERGMLKAGVMKHIRVTGDFTPR